MTLPGKKTLTLPNLLIGAVKLSLIIILAFPLLAVYFLTVGYDEAWMLATVGNIISKGEYAAGAYAGPLTTGGVYALSQAVIGFFFPGNIFLARIFSYICLLLLFNEVRSILQRFFDDRVSGLIASTAFFAVPGALTLTVQAYGFLPAMLFCVYGIKQWKYAQTGSRLGLLWSGILLGIASATRMEFLVVLPSVIVSVLWMSDRRRELPKAITLILIAVVAFSLSVYALSLFSPNEAVLLAEAKGGTGFADIGFNYVKLFRKWEVLNGFLPVALAIAVSIVPYYACSNLFRFRQYLILALAAAWALLSFWLFLSPIPHLRYIWPALMVFFLILGICIGALYQAGTYRGIKWMRISALVITIALQCASVIAATRQIASGNSDILSWEWSRETELQPFSAFKQASMQRTFADYLVGNLPQDEQVGVLGACITLRYLTGLECVGFEEWKRGLVDLRKPPRFIVIDTMMGTYLYPDSEAFSKLISNSEIVYSNGGYSLREVKDSFSMYDELFMNMSRGFVLPK